ncbi:Uncharacterised protein [Mycobacterium tuberculosis]|nr:Uncharacterised protein [Mycobacterium tuberculosis]
MPPQTPLGVRPEVRTCSRQATGVAVSGVPGSSGSSNCRIVSSSTPANHSRGWGAIPVLGRYWKNSCGSPAQPVARSDSTSSVLPLRWVASTRYGLTARDIR